MFRLLLHIIISLLLLISTSGMVVSKHYCGGAFYDVSVYFSPDDCCGDTCDGCRNENEVLQVDDDFYIVQAIEHSIFVQLDIFMDNKATYCAVVRSVSTNDFNINEPPPDGVNVLLSKYQLYLC